MDTIASYLRTLNDRKQLLSQLQEQLYAVCVQQSIDELNRVINDI